MSKPTRIETHSPNSPFFKHFVAICGQNGQNAGVKIETIGTLEAKTHFSALLDKVQQGEIYHITKHGKIIAELKGIDSGFKTPKAGFAKGLFGDTTSDFDAPLEDFSDYME